MWDLPRPGTKPVSPESALAGGFLATGPPGKSSISCDFGSHTDELRHRAAKLAKYRNKLKKKSPKKTSEIISRVLYTFYIGGT